MTDTMEESQTTSLYYRGGSRDKEYHVRLATEGSGFVCLDDRLRGAARREGFAVLP